MTKEKNLKVRNLIVGIFLSYLTLQIINYFISSAFYLSLAINFSNRYMLFALAYFIITINLENHKPEAKRFFFLVISIFILTIAPIGFLIFKIKEFDLNDPLSSLLYIDITLHLLSLYTISYSIKMLRKINLKNKNKNKISFLPHIIYLTLMVMFVVNDLQLIIIPPLVLDGIGLFGAMVLIRSINSFRDIIS